LSGRAECAGRAIAVAEDIHGGVLFFCQTGGYRRNVFELLAESVGPGVAT